MRLLLRLRAAVLFLVATSGRGALSAAVRGVSARLERVSTEGVLTDSLRDVISAVVEAEGEEQRLEAAKVALVEAAKFGHRELVGALIDEGEGLLRAGDDSIADDRGRTPLMYAALCAQNSKHAACPLPDALIQPRHDEVAELLVRAGALLDATDNDDRTALMFAAMSEHTE